jgi:hypothetical protein
MMLQNDIGNRPGKLDPFQDFVADLGMGLDDAELQVIQSAGFAKYLGGDIELSDIMRKSGRLNAHHFPGRQPQGLADLHSQKSNSSLVHCGVRVSDFNNGVYGLDYPVIKPLGLYPAQFHFGRLSGSGQKGPEVVGCLLP